MISQLGNKQNISSAYHPQSQGDLERFHHTLKIMLKAYCYEQEKNWDEDIPLLLFAIRESVQESLGFSPFELIYRREVLGPLKLLKEHWLGAEESGNLLYKVSELRHRLTKAREIETLALVLTLQHFDVYLNTTKYPIVVHTDHNPLVFINKMKNYNQRLLRWGLLLQEYDMDIHHIKGRKMSWLMRCPE